MRQLELWQDDRPTPNLPASPSAADIHAGIGELSVPEHRGPETQVESQLGLPVAVPLASAVEAGVFGLTEEGPIQPDEVQVSELTAEHANEMIILLADAQILEDALHHEYDPATGRVPKTPEERQGLLARLDMEWKRMLQAYSDAVAAYADGFGDAAAEALDQWVRKTLADGAQEKEPYPPSHPWHYFHAGDNAPPIPVDRIPADPDAGRWLAERLPKNPTKRAQKLQEMLAREQEALAADTERYIDIVQRGADALSRYDREIAHTSDAMAVATALALKYNHISQGLGRVAWIAQELESYGPDLFPRR